ncbi:MAG: hypothetical protein V4488_20250 [Pseudomonadota bacterium]
MTIQHFLIFAAMLSATEIAVAQLHGNEPTQKGPAPGLTATEKQGGDWISYRNAYKLMIRFEKYGKPKQFIQNHYQVLPKDKSVTMEGLSLTLNGKLTHLNLSLDAVGRAVFPLLKSAYDENAELNLNRKASLYVFQARVSIIARADGVYEAEDLQAACEQALNYLRYAGDISQGEKKCAGVRFSYAKNANDAAVKFRTTAQVLTQMPVREGSAFPDDAMSTNAFKTVTYRFADWPEHGQIITQSAPIAIAALFE